MHYGLHITHRGVRWALTTQLFFRHEVQQVNRDQPESIDKSRNGQRPRCTAGQRLSEPR